MDTLTSPQPSLQFEVPPSADSDSFAPIIPVSASHKRPFSIDLSLELERQLDMESLPPTPAHNATMHANSAPVIAQLRDSLDPDVLAHIISQLRRSLSDLSKEKDDLVSLLSSAHSREADLEDALQHMTDKATGMEEELTEARRKNKDDEEAISMLRTKVEESRRGLMRLQTENRRQSAQIAPLDLSRASLSSLNFSPPSKRTSFTPLTGSFSGRPANAHRRISSVSDSGLQALNNHLNFGLALSPEHNSQVLTIPGENANPNPSPMSNRRMSGFFAGHANALSPLDVFSSDSSAELQSLRKEIVTLKSDLEETRHELTEAVEAREASETCVSALRAFIEENNVGGGSVSGQNESDTASIRLPPPPVSTTGNEAETSSIKSGWGFKLWNAKPTPILNNFNTPASASVDSPTLPSAAIQTPTQISKKIGGFFSRQSSISSVAVVALPAPAPPSLQARESMYSYDSKSSSRSDTSSIEEPLSPVDDDNGDGMNIMVREGSSRSAPHDPLDLVAVDLGESKKNNVEVNA
ncbi:hypothetical protein J3R30DRAFT_3377522 [Lentinula aciculospora]|uniref:Uncharacterized protein n=1 Tax=Lentinula aciculospora TaxID=153920 RepID=A0A9W9DKU2_9AGAR|nr:hypothetical protein J3R30DRAFT_3377522 [Lentinula aciculospora]